MDFKTALQLIQDSFDSMKRSEMIDNSLQVKPDTVILGEGSPLDSLGFVTLISDLEERVCDASGQDHYLVLTDIQDFNSDQAYLSAEALALYIEKITE